MEEHTAGYLVGVGIGVAIGLIVVAVILKVTRNDGGIRCKFDERQAIIRGKGYQYGFISLVICNILYALLSATDLKLPVDLDMAVFLGIFISIVVMISYLIWHDAYFALNERRPRVMIAFMLIAALNLWLGVKSILEGRAVRDGVLTGGSLNLFCGILFIIIFVVLLAKHIKEASGMQEDEE